MAKTVCDMDRPTQPLLRVRLLGGFELTGADRGDLTPLRKKLRALVALLALAPPAGWSREQLMSLLWDGREEEQARGSLRQALAELRRTLGDTVLRTDRELAAFDSAVVSVDAAEFASLAATSDLERAASLYFGELLEGVSLPDGGFMDWYLVERTRLHDLAIGVFARLLDTQSGEVAIATAQRLLQLDPAREATHRALMRLYVKAGVRSQALRQYQICCESLQRDLGVEPEDETQRLYKEILSSESPESLDHNLESFDHRTDKNASLAAQAPPLPNANSPWRSYLLPKSLWVRLAPAAVVTLTLAAGAAWWFGPDAAPSIKPAVAVLPFDNLAGDATTDRLADGLTEEIITDLARFPEFRVIARNSTDVYKGKPADSRDIGAKLKVGFVVEGSIQRESQRVRITAQLVETTTGSHLWSQRWDRPYEDVFSVQTEISEQIANRMGGGAGLVQEAGRIAARRKPPSNLTAYDLYLLGTERLEQITPGDVEDAIELLTRAVVIDPELARAWVELAHSHNILAKFGIAADANRQAGAEAAERAVRLDPSDAEAHAVYGIGLANKGDFVRAKAEFDAALQLAPGAAEILTFYSAWASTFGEPQRGADMVDKVIRLNPNYPMWSAGPFAYAYFMAGRYEDALQMMDRLAPDSYMLHTWIMRGGALAAVGRGVEAKTSVEQALERHPDLTVESVANEPHYNEAEINRFVDTMRLAGFPLCAKPETLAGTEKPLRLPECQDGSNSQN
jgi:TolB-like protein/DNA-binding SARP family transcriptional activator/Flp pilus assembly protein TadD